MARIEAPNKQCNGVSASVQFNKGIGETSDPHLINWFRSHGYAVIDPEPVQEVQIDPEPAEKPTGRKTTKKG